MEKNNSEKTDDSEPLFVGQLNFLFDIKRWLPSLSALCLCIGMDYSMHPAKKKKINHRAEIPRKAKKKNNHPVFILYFFSIMQRSNPPMFSDVV